MKKKFGLLATLALCVTVGGVYATWTYATNGVQEAGVQMGLAMAGLGDATVYGSISVENTNATIAVDNMNGYKAGLSYGADGKFTVTFTTAAAGVSQDILKNGIKMGWYIYVEDTTTHTQVTEANLSNIVYKTNASTTDARVEKAVFGNGTDLYAIVPFFGADGVKDANNTPGNIGDIGDDTARLVSYTLANGVNVLSSTFVYEISVADVAEKLGFFGNDDEYFLLDELGEYNEFKAILTRYAFHFHVVDMSTVTTA